MLQLPSTIRAKPNPQNQPHQYSPETKRGKEGKKERNEKNSREFSTRDSHVVTHHNTNQAMQYLFTAERTGCETFIALWPNTFSLFAKPEMRRVEAPSITR